MTPLSAPGHPSAAQQSHESRRDATQRETAQVSLAARAGRTQRSRHGCPVRRPRTAPRAARARWGDRLPRACAAAACPRARLVAHTRCATALCHSQLRTYMRATQRRRQEQQQAECGRHRGGGRPPSAQRPGLLSAHRRAVKRLIHPASNVPVLGERACLMRPTTRDAKCNCGATSRVDAPGVGGATY